MFFLPLQVTQLADPDASVEGREKLSANRTLAVAGEQSGWASLLGVSSSLSNAGGHLCMHFRFPVVMVLVDLHASATEK